ncbi:hypothetical protein [Zhengella mangrovi]|uniref:hypothetical protein n=1 Tax=Zhengella mangrovi TaxID=1982044 RepID=UPI001054EE9B|nr:hypothetical protein [Zhengella mangrovi]
MAKGWFFVLKNGLGTQPYRVAIKDALEARLAVFKKCRDAEIVYAERMEETGIEADTIQIGHFLNRHLSHARICYRQEPANDC